MHPTHLVMSWLGLTCAHTSHFPAHTPLTSPVHLAHLPMSPPPCILLTSLGPCQISPHAYASHLCIFPTSLCLLPCASCPPHYISVGPHPCVSVDGVYGQMWGGVQQRKVTSRDATRTD